MGQVGARKKSEREKCTRQQEFTAQQYTTSALAGAKFKTEYLAYNNAYCSWLFQATLDHLSFGTDPLWRLKGAMQISVIGHPLKVPFQGYFITRVAGSFRF